MGAFYSLYHILFHSFDRPVTYTTAIIYVYWLLVHIVFPTRLLKHELLMVDYLIYVTFYYLLVTLFDGLGSMDTIKHFDHIIVIHMRILRNGRSRENINNEHSI
jgi:hypothetical protein